MGSVSQIGWEWYSRLSARTPVTLITHERNRKALTQVGAPIADSAIHFIDTEWFAGPLYRSASRIFPKSQHSAFLISSLDYFPYDRGAVKLLQSMIPARNWDLVHAVTPVSPAAATRLHRLGLPLVLGPWNGGLQSPSTFPDIMREDSGWLYKVRDIGKCLDRSFGTTAAASVILSATKATDASISSANRPRCFRMVENGVDLAVFKTSDWIPPSVAVPLRIVFTGRLVPFKGVSLLIEAVRRFREEFPIELTIVGDGPLRADLELLAKSTSVDGSVRFLGNLPPADVAKAMAEAHLFCLPSVRESGGAVVLEAMATALPVLAVEYGGPAEIIDDETGRLLSAKGPEPLIADMVKAFRGVVANPALWRRKGLTGRSRAERLYGWEAKIEAALQIYEQVIRKRPIHA